VPEAIPKDLLGLLACEHRKAVAAAGGDEIDLVVDEPMLEAMATSIFERASSVGSKLNFWNTKPIFDFLMRVRAASESVAKSTPSMTTLPESARVKPPSK